MRVWDVSPGYLSRQRLLGEHRELHGLYVILTESRDGYSRHPETLRWAGAVTGLAWRHAQLVAEMRLRGYTDRTPLACASGGTWPTTFVTEPADQFSLLRVKYGSAQRGRITLPRQPQQLWAQHKYSVMARDPQAYRRYGRAVARITRGESYRLLARELVLILRSRPAHGRLMNTLEHMWGHVADRATIEERRAARTNEAALLRTTRVVAARVQEPFLLSSTALGELGVYVEQDDVD